eukprot:3250555-Pyramimonas_sp.AAC.2
MPWPMLHASAAGRAEITHSIASDTRSNKRCDASIVRTIAAIGTAAGIKHKTRPFPCHRASHKRNLLCPGAQ